MTISDPTSEEVGFLVSYGLGFLALLWVVFLFFIKKSDKKRGQPPLPPGPKPLPLLGNLLSLDSELHTYFAGLSKDYGPILTFWLGKKVGIIISSPIVAKEVLKDQDTVFANRDVPAAALESAYGGRDIAWSPYGPEWRMLRKVCVREMLSSATLDSFYELRRKEIQQTIKFLHSQIGKKVNVGEQMFLNVLNVITNMLWGGTVKGEERASMAAEFRQVVTLMVEQLGKPNISDFYPSLGRFDLQGIRKKTRDMAVKFDGIFDRLIEQRGMEKMGGGDDGEIKKSKDFLEFLMLSKDKGDAKIPLTMTHLKALLMVSNPII